MTSRMQGIQDRLVENGRKNVQKGVPKMSDAPSRGSASSAEFVPERKPINVFQTMILLALNNPKLGKHIYAGTADPVAVAKRRKANKLARKQRKVNREK